MAVKAKSKPATIEDYLDALPPSQRAAMDKLRRAIRAAAPQAEEVMGSSFPTFRLGTQMLAGYAATGRDCALYVMNASAHAADLAKYEISKGAVRFSPDKPLPAALVRKLVKARIAEYTAMNAGRAKPPKRAAAGRTDPAVEALIAEMNHPRKPELVALRKLIRSADRSITEGVKWNSPSFRTSEYFATINVHGKDALRLILHTGAKVRGGKPPKVDDPAGVLKWLAKDRCLITIEGAADLKAKSRPLKAIIKSWISQM